MFLTFSIYRWTGQIKDCIGARLVYMAEEIINLTKSYCPPPRVIGMELAFAFNYISRRCSVANEDSPTIRVKCLRSKYKSRKLFVPVVLMVIKLLL